MINLAYNLIWYYKVYVSQKGISLDNINSVAADIVQNTYSVLVKASTESLDWYTLTEETYNNTECLLC